VFEENNLAIEDKIDARKQQIDEEAAWKMIQGVSTVVIGKGKKVLTYTPSDDNREAIMKSAMGRSGSLRAPAIIKDGRLYIGFNDDIYAGF
jgi:arsenate reductase-like glutaredoxin family protein